MTYTEFVKKNEHSYIKHGLIKHAWDTVNILDNPIFVEISQEAMIPVRESLMDVGNYFRHLCLQCELELNESLLRFTNNKMVLLPKSLFFDPGKSVRILVVDDMLSDLIDTSRAFIGWPHLQIECFHYQPVPGRIIDVKEFAKSVLKKGPDIILMDQDLDDLCGYDAVRVLRKEMDKIIFVANTDSEDDSQMLEAGCLSNCGKGDFPEGLRNALKIFKDRT